MTWGTGKMISEPTSQHKELQLPEGNTLLGWSYGKEGEKAGG